MVTSHPPPDDSRLTLDPLHKLCDTFILQHVAKILATTRACTFNPISNSHCTAIPSAVPICTVKKPQNPSSSPENATLHVTIDANRNQIPSVSIQVRTCGLREHPSAIPTPSLVPCT